jgi:hypothetical protein
MIGYMTLDQCLALVADPWQGVLAKLLKKWRREFETSPGSTHNHQAWRGGYIDHVTEICNIAHLLYGPMNNCRNLPFTLSDAILVLFLHDIEKPFKQVSEFTPPAGFEDINPAKDYCTSYKDVRKTWALLCLSLSTLPDHIVSAIYYAEGEKDHYTNKERKMSELAAFVHMCDIASARIWHDRPDAQQDSWGGRIRALYGYCTGCNQGIGTTEELRHTSQGDALCIGCHTSSRSLKLLPEEKIDSNREPVIFTAVPGMFEK